MHLVLATHNAHKRLEVERILQGMGVVATLVVPKGKPPLEDGATFAENALIKARAAHRSSGLPAIADDSGIVVRALGNEPGIHSARYSPSGTDLANRNLLLANLGDHPDRFAHFVCAVAFCYGGTEEVIERRWLGRIATEAHGSGGFGYDPIFIPAGFEVTAAQLSPAEKDLVSHRGQAFRAMASRLESLLPRS